MINLNLGCGHNKLTGWVNVDLFPECSPDLVLDLESLPWPWANDSVDRVLFNHSLEHLGQDTHTFLGMVKELFRVCRDGAQVEINVPHPRHDDFISDPTHVRIVTPELLKLFDHEYCDEVQRRGAANSPLAHYLHVDFSLSDITTVLAEPYSTQYTEGLLSDDDLAQLSRELNNVIKEYRMVVIARKHR